VTLGWSTSFGVDQLGRREHSMPKATVAGATVVDDTAEQGFVWVSEPLPVQHGGETPPVATGRRRGSGRVTVIRRQQRRLVPAPRNLRDARQNSTTSDPSRPETAPTAEQPSEQDADGHLRCSFTDHYVYDGVRYDIPT
jgi:hypothetical protein